MSDTAFDEIERGRLARSAFPSLPTLAHVEGTMTLDAVPHDAFYFLLTITLPGGATLTSYMPKNKIVEQGRGRGQTSSRRCCC